MTDCTELQQNYAELAERYEEALQIIAELKQRLFQINIIAADEQERCQRIVARNHQILKRCEAILGQPSGVPRGKWAYVKGLGKEVKSHIKDVMASLRKFNQIEGLSDVS